MSVRVSEELERVLGNALQRHGDVMTVIGEPEPLSGEIYKVEMLAPDGKTRRRCLIAELRDSKDRWVLITLEGGLLPAHLIKLEAPGLVS